MGVYTSCRQHEKEEKKMRELAPYKQFKYDVRKSYEMNYWIWKDMADYEAKCENRKYYTEEEGQSIFRKQYGYHMPKHQSRYAEVINFR
tara:strand:+ start:768 stop:1034 length:267 start_codon:yes stop_codon:yes gene_type:complete